MNKRYSKIVAILVVFALLIGTGAALGLNYLTNKKASEQEQAKQELLDQGIINVLLLGIDARPKETQARSDSMILVSIDTTNKKVGLISIPRDTRIKDGDSYQKINSYNFIGGPELAKAKVEELLGVPIHYYALTNFSGFKDIVDILGGVTIDVDKRMYKPSEGIDLQPGVQRLNGTQALAYCRFRTDALGDIMRIQRQQNFLKALAGELMKPATITKLPKLASQVNKYITTDIPLSKMVKIARAAEQFQQGQSRMVAQSLPGWFYNDPHTGASYWVIDEQKLPGIVDKVLKGETMDFVETAPADQLANQAKPSKSKPKPSTVEPEEKPDNNGDVTTNPTDNNNDDSSDTVNPPADDSGDNNNNGDNTTPPDTGDNSQTQDGGSNPDNSIS